MKPGRFAWPVVVVALAASGGMQTRGQTVVEDEAQPITPTARQLNELWATEGRRWVAGFESADRALFQKRFEVVDSLKLMPGMNVADIGAGSGFYSLLMAKRVAPGGVVYAVDISPGLVEYVAESAKAEGLTNVKAVLGDSKSPKLPDQSVDLVFVADTYHHFEYPKEMLLGIRKALRRDGLFVVIDFDRVDGVSHPFILRDVRAGKAVFVHEISSAGFELVGEAPMFEDEYMLKFRRKRESE